MFYTTNCAALLDGLYGESNHNENNMSLIILGLYISNNNKAAIMPVWPLLTRGNCLSCFPGVGLAPVAYVLFFLLCTVALTFMIYMMLHVMLRV
jgi:hypothetical protein